MAQGYDTEEQKERVLLVGVQLDNQEDMESSLEELKALAKTAGAETVGKVIQPRDAYHPATYIGKGKLEEVRSLIEETGATGIICDDELSPAQLRNLEDALGTKVMDRTMVILDIFASRATTSEGKIQVEVAQLKYRSTRLTGLGTTLSRLGGGIGTRGPGEKKLETDRRIIRDRISRLSKDLEEIKNHREVARQNRSRTAVPVAAIVGYTNAGKSTLLNYMTDAGILSEDKLFATLDPTTRAMNLPNGEKILLTDTVGFIRKLPHNLIEAFKKVKTDKKLVIAGGASDTDEYANKLKELAKGDDRIIFTGFVQGKILEELYSNAYVYTLPSDLEGMPLSLLEAMSYGNCCLVSDIDECSEVVEDKALIFKKADVEELQNKLQNACNDVKQVEGLKKQAANFICEKYNWDDVVKLTEDLYRSK